jgi:hypothetical protein
VAFAGKLLRVTWNPQGTPFIKELIVSEAAHPWSGSTAATSSSSSELELINQLKQQLPGPLFAAVSDQFSNNWSCWNWSRESALWKSRRRASALRSSPRRRRGASILDVRNCQRLRDYLAAVLPGLADFPIRRLPDLMPSAWAMQRL